MTNPKSLPKIWRWKKIPFQGRAARSSPERRDGRRAKPKISEIFRKSPPQRTELVGKWLLPEPAPDGGRGLERDGRKPRPENREKKTELPVANSEA